MKKLAVYCISLILATFATIPAINFAVPLPLSWLPWLVLFAGLLAFLTLMIETNFFIRSIAIGSFVNCFFSVAPFYSFISFLSLIGACYFYILCRKIDDWGFVFKMLQAILFLNIFLIFVQIIHKDTLLSFGATTSAYSGVIGNTMQTGSMIIVLTAFLISSSRLNILVPVIVSFPCVTAWTLFCGIIGWFVFLFKECRKEASIFLAVMLIVFVAFSTYKEKFAQNISHIGRTGVWARTVELGNQRPLTGWGIGSYKYVFPPLCNIPTGLPWRTAHNSFVQLYFEAGIVGVLFFAYTIFALGKKLLSLNLINCFAGLIMIVLDSFVHFPERMLQAVFIIVAFVAFCEFKIKEKENVSQ